LHILAIDGVFEKPAEKVQTPRLHSLAGPSDEEVAAIVEKISTRVVKLLRRLEYLSDEAEYVVRPDADDMFKDNAAIAAALGASVQSYCHQWSSSKDSAPWCLRPGLTKYFIQAFSHRTASGEI
jgi:hypothetical protein